MADRDLEIAILGAGLAGLSTSYHLGHPTNTAILEAKDHYGGHVHSWERDGITWDDGPHCSITMNEYIKTLFAEFVDGEYEDVDVKAVNYYQGHWLDYPALTSLHQVPEPLRTQCLESFLEWARGDHAPPKNYEEWLYQAMGKVFADNFPASYTRKYWTCEPRNLDVDWIGQRILRPEVDDVVNGAKGPLPKGMYYVSDRSPRYPSKGGFLSYCHKMAADAVIRYGMKMEQIDFGKQRLRFTDGTEMSYGRLVSTIPVPYLIKCSTDAPDDVREAAALLRSSQFYRVDVAVNHPRPRDEIWYYVYDEDKLSVRISLMERFSPHNAPPGKTAIQVEVYGSAWRPMPEDRQNVKATVIEELLEMGLIETPDAIESSEITLVPTGQIIYDLNRRDALRVVNGFLNEQGVHRVGRYSEWKYLMSDSCVLGGRRAARLLRAQEDDTDWEGVAINPDDVPDELIGKVSADAKYERDVADGDARGSPMKVVIFCGGMGLRLREHEEQIPKPMMPLGSRPLLWHVMRYYAHFGHNDFILCLGYRAQAIKEYFLSYNEALSNDFVLEKGGKEVTLLGSDMGDWRISFVDTGLKSNVGQRLKAVENYIDDDVFLANYADVLSDVHLPTLIDEFYERDVIAQMLAVQPHYTFHLIEADDAGMVVGMRDVHNSDMYINGGYFVLGREIFDYIGEGEELVLEPFERLTAKRKLAAHRHDGFWTTMDTIKDKQVLEEMYQNGDRPWCIWE